MSTDLAPERLQRLCGNHQFITGSRPLPQPVADRYNGSMTTTMPTRVDGDLYAAAKSSGAAASRSAAQQLSHWARIGRELEAAPDTILRDIQRVLAGEKPYDDLDERGQAIVRASWDERIAERRARLDLAAEFTQAGRSWTEADEQGSVVVRNVVARPGGAVQGA